ncbi:MAG: GNAT family N-acetyltransferase [Anaerolineae bacterium]|nr:GNAT family N-acetyltransferase [Anaerolineae bacterium]
MTIIDFQMRMGAAAIRMAGIAGVGTAYKHRNKDYMRILFDDTIAYIRAQNYAISALYVLS